MLQGASDRAIVVGVGVFLGYVAAGMIGYVPKAPPEPNIYASLVALIPAFVTAYIGAGARWIAAPGIGGPAHR